MINIIMYVYDAELCEYICCVYDKYVSYIIYI